MRRNHREILGASLRVFLAVFTARGERGEPMEASLGQGFGLPVGGQASIASERIIVRFIAVLQDSRCPKGVQCIVAGNAVVEMRVQVGDEEPAIVELSPATASADADVGRYHVRLEALEPYPVSGKPILREEYVARLLVTRL